jgi:hypothetical protein
MTTRGDQNVVLCASPANVVVAIAVVVTEAELALKSSATV